MHNSKVNTNMTIVHDMASLVESQKNRELPAVAVAFKT